jgi:menaquinone-dependent protoporphyrinogen oxidase
MHATATGELRVGEAGAAGIETPSSQRLAAAPAAAERSTPPRVLVAYASKHGATQGIAERIADTLRAAGLVVDLQPAKTAADPAAYDACVVGSAAYMGSWLEEATAFVQSNAGALASRPVWLFSSGPTGAQRTDAQGRDLRELSVPKESAGFERTIHPRGHRVFFGKVDFGQLGLVGRLVAHLPASWLPGVEGDFRDWADIDAWAHRIAAALRGSAELPG